jgi:hypothetical protein
MKKLLVLFVLLLPAIFLQAQNSALDKLFEKYSGADGFTTVYISKAMFEMFAAMDTTPKNSDDMNQVVSKLSGIRILAVEDKNKVPKGFNLYDEVMNATKNFHYEELMVVKDNNSNVRFLVQKKGPKVAELLLIVGGSDDNVAISIQGDIDMKSISKLSKMMNIEGMDQLNNLK